MVAILEIIRKLEDSINKLDIHQRSICTIILMLLSDANGKFISKQSEVITGNKYLELFISHSNDYDTNFSVILFKDYIELSCAGFTFRLDYEEEIFREYFSALLDGEYTVVRISVGKHIINDRLFWNKKSLESKIRKSYLYYLRFLFDQKKVVQKSYQSFSFLSN